ncbi:hypothetical protein [Fervidobacterium gondwanense]|uniref:Capsule assembly protein Wzi n=1 Tax=Fervidobacterium gondwanense DSM 13020 TaxID=1121883 RepID=A0A1M7SKT1_FERGO|nr:hypothetical protein [Fervidobacterium gondwanense]SHN59093.1 hypothetical protein SAMN02745226_01016 [Fervidobacterium gondwanense DSM 13020]
MEKRNRTIVLAVITILFPILNFAFQTNINVSYNSGSTLFSLYNAQINTSQILSADIELKHENENFDFFASMIARNDNFFNDHFSSSYYAGFYFVVDESGFRVRNGNVTVTLGKIHLSDVVQSPYSLFISSVHVPRNTFDVSFDSETFLYTTRWIQLSNLQSGSDIREKLRSANYKLYGVKFGNFRFGYQDVAVYVGKEFDFEYFANPVPSFFIQYVNDAGRPYSEGLGDANYISGFFLDYDTENLYWYAQILVDDINANRFLHPESYQNPDKIAWSVGANFKNIFGKFGLFHAGATKYTFQPSSESGNPLYYGYTYYPCFTYTKDSTTMVLPLEYLYAGYIYGENNLAFMITYDSSVVDGLSADAEFIILGERSPINPWNESSTYVPGTHLLDDNVLEYRLISRLNYLFTVADWLKFELKGALGYIWNASVLVNVDSDNVKKPILRPMEGNNFPYFSLSLGLIFNKNF